MTVKTRFIPALLLVACAASCVNVLKPGVATNPEAEGKPGIGNQVLSGGRRAVYGFDGPALVFLIVTDGIALPQTQKTSNYYVFGKAWSGTIQPITKGHKDIVFKARGGGIDFGSQHFDFDQGRAFIVTTSGPRMAASQVPIPLSMQIEGIVSIDPRFNMETEFVPAGPISLPENKPQDAAPNAAPNAAPESTPQATAPGTAPAEAAPAENQPIQQ